MEVKPIEVYSEATNHAVVRMPGRQFPGSVVQGDSLSTLCSLAEGLCRQAEGGEDLHELAAELRDLLRERLSHYESVLERHGIPLPYVKPQASQ